ncbi:MAG: putative esterase [Nocardioidaceae bacterium]|nr:putative esterase [Nocardioidaceae bacterium]
MVSGVEGAEVVFRLDDPEGHLTAVRLWQELGLPGDSLDFEPVDGGWELRLPRPTVHRMEYLFQVTGVDGEQATAVDPTNPRVVGGAFGEHSVLELPGYQPPAWCEAEEVPSRLEPLTVPGTPLGTTVTGQIWSPDDSEPDEMLPLLVCHDGPEFAAHAALTRYVGALVADDALPRMRLAMLDPGERNTRYAADLDYAATLTQAVLPAVRDRYATRENVVLMGASLGALAALHAEWSHPESFAGLFLQSGSFFTPETDPQEAGFPGFGAITGFVQRVLAARAAPSSPAVTLTCGSAEENVHNNRVMAARLAAFDWDVSFTESPDVHNFTAWRDTLDPHLTALLHRVWGQVGGGEHAA